MSSVLFSLITVLVWLDFGLTHGPLAPAVEESTAADGSGGQGWSVGGRRLCRWKVEGQLQVSAWGGCRDGRGHGARDCIPQCVDVDAQGGPRGSGRGERVGS